MFNGFCVTSIFIVDAAMPAFVVEIDDCAPAESVIGLLLDVLALTLLVIVGLLVGFRVTNVDLTVDVPTFAGNVGCFLSSPADTTEYVVVNVSSSLTAVVDSTRTIELVGFGLGLGAFVVST